MMTPRLKCIVLTLFSLMMFSSCSSSSGGAGEKDLSIDVPADRVEVDVLDLNDSASVEVVDLVVDTEDEVSLLDGISDEGLMGDLEDGVDVAEDLLMDSEVDADVDVKPACVPPMPTCTVTCSSDEECTILGNPTMGIYDEDNWSCVDGACRWTGCHDNAECAAEPSLEGKEYRCIESNCGMRLCLTKCAEVVDCLPSTYAGTAFDDNNYACEGGLCRYLGCMSDEECTDSYKVAGEPRTWECVEGNEGVGVCMASCFSPIDCVPAGSNEILDSNNWACQESHCVYKGCQSTDECEKVYQYSPQDWVCSDSYWAL